MSDAVNGNGALLNGLKHGSLCFCGRSRRKLTGRLEGERTSPFGFFCDILRQSARKEVMGTAVQAPASAELFYSYAHADEPLCRELQKHLTALKRAGLISDWYDGKIEPGSEWASQIQEALERAGIILLLISADFLASQYIFEVELPFALERHKSGRATVIPVLLRPVEWHDLPFAQLQVLPSEARPVTLWPNQDAAFSDVAGRLRELLYSQRLREVTLQAAARAIARLTQERVLDAAISSSVVVDEPTDLVILVRRTESEGLRAILRLDRSYSPAENDVRSKSFELDFTADASGVLLPATLQLALESPNFDPPKQEKKIRIPPAGDSDVAVFMLTPKRVGTLRLSLEALSGGVEIASRVLLTTSVPAVAAQPSFSYGVISFPLRASTDRPEAFAVGARDTEVRFEPIGVAAPAPAPSADQSRSGRSESRAVPPARGPVIVPRKSSPRRSVWVSIASAAAAIALVSTALVWNIRAPLSGSRAPEKPAITHPNAHQATRSPPISSIAQPKPSQPSSQPLREEDPRTTVWFDRNTGQPRLWYSRDSKSRFHFFNRPGNNPTSGAKLLPVTPEIYRVWAESQRGTEGEQR